MYQYKIIPIFYAKKCSLFGSLCQQKNCGCGGKAATNKNSKYILVTNIIIFYLADATVRTPILSINSNFLNSNDISFKVEPVV